MAHVHAPVLLVFERRTYDDESGSGEDLNLTRFSIAHDERLKIPLIKSAMQVAAAAGGTPISLFASPWAPPAWMTAQNTTTHNPTLKGGVTGPIAVAYARYLVKFFEAYAAPEHGISFWGLTAQNEPAGNTGAWQDLKFTAEQQRDFIRDVLGPAMRSSNATRDVDLMIMDDQRVHLPGWADTVLADPEAAKFVAGIALHWYAAVEDSTPSALYFGKMKETHDKHKGTFMFVSSPVPTPAPPTLAEGNEGGGEKHVGRCTAWGMPSPSLSSSQPTTYPAVCRQHCSHIQANARACMYARMHAYISLARAFIRCQLV